LELPDDDTPELEECQRALLELWMTPPSAVVDLADRTSAQQASREFAELFYGEDDPEQLKAIFGSPEATERISSMIGDAPFELQMSFDCEALPCILDLELAYVGELTDRSEIYEQRLVAFEDINAELPSMLPPGYHAIDLAGGGDDLFITTRSQEEMDELVAGITLFVSDVFGMDQRAEEEWD